MPILRSLAILFTFFFLAVGQPVALLADTLVAAETFLDDSTVAPGAGTSLGLNGDSVDALRDAVGALDMTSVEPGSHTLYLRFQDNTGAWSELVGQSFFVTPGAPDTPLLGGENRIEAAEAFIDTDPGEGNGIPLDIPVDGVIDSTMEKLRAVLDFSGLGLVHRKV